MKRFELLSNLKEVTWEIWVKIDVGAFSDLVRIFFWSVRFLSHATNYS